jgi:hypothetical protein
MEIDSVVEVCVVRKVSARPEFGRFFLRSVAKKTVDDEQQNRTARCNKYAANIEGINLSEADETAQKAAQDASNYADENRDKDASGILAGHDELRKRPCDQT